MSELNITYKRPNAKPERNEELYRTYQELSTKDMRYDDVMYELVKEFDLSRTRVAKIISTMNKKLKNSKK